MRRARRCLLILVALTPPSVAAQVRTVAPEDDAPAPVVTTRPPDANAGPIGQRQTREQAARRAGIVPMARIDNRIANRVQSRPRTRIDRDYDPQANAASPFTVAGERTRIGGRAR